MTVLNHLKFIFVNFKFQFNPWIGPLDYYMIDPWLDNSDCTRIYFSKIKRKRVFDLITLFSLILSVENYFMNMYG